MPEEEREVRMKALRYRERQMDVNFWMKSFLKSVGNLIGMVSNRYFFGQKFQRPCLEIICYIILKSY